VQLTSELLHPSPDLISSHPFEDLPSSSDKMWLVGDLIFFFSKHTTLWARHNDQEIAASPTICTFLFLGINLSHHSQN
jgi:hypothetical protein